MESFTPGNETERQFRDALGSFATGVTVVTARTAEGPVGITANSFASVSLNPPLVLWSPARASGRFAAFLAARHYAIHILSAEQAPLCRHFTRAPNGFKGVEISENAHGVPLIEGCLARFECEQTGTHDGGDHMIILGRVSRVTRRAGAPLVFHAGHFQTLAPL